MYGMYEVCQTAARAAAAVWLVIVAWNGWMDGSHTKLPFVVCSPDPLESLSSPAKGRKTETG